MSHGYWLIGVLAAVFVSCDVCADKTETVYAPVTRIEPVVTEPAAPLDKMCDQPRPANRDGLSALLAWELADCLPQALKVSRYRVYYQWDGRTYSQLMKQRPGRTVPLQLRIH